MHLDEETEVDYLETLRKFSTWTGHGTLGKPHDNARCVQCRRTLLNILHLMPVNIAVIVLASVDAAILVAVLLLEIEALKLEPGDKQDRLVEARFGLECVSIVILSIFMIEISLKMFALGPKAFFRHWIEVLDLVVVVISLVVDAVIIAFHVAHKRNSHRSGDHPSVADNSTDQLDAFGAAAGLLVVFRLWRIVGIMNATIVTIHGGLEATISKIKEEKRRLQCRVIQLEGVLEEANLPLPMEMDDSKESDHSDHHHHHHHHHSQRHHHNSLGHMQQTCDLTAEQSDRGNME